MIIASIDAASMCPLIKCDLVEKAVNYFAKDLNDDDKSEIRNCLEMTKFGMGTMHIQFDGNHCEHDSNDNIAEKGLTIRGFESGWLSDLAMVFLLLNTLEMIEEMTEYFGMCCDDELAVFRGNLQQSDAAKWLERFQNAVNEIAGNDKLQLMAAAWGKTRKTCQKTRR